MGPGAIIAVQVPDDRQIEVIVPPGVGAGAVFAVQVPPPDPPRSAADTPVIVMSAPHSDIEDPKADTDKAAEAVEAVDDENVVDDPKANADEAVETADDETVVKAEKLPGNAKQCKVTQATRATQPAR